MLATTPAPIFIHGWKPLTRRPGTRSWCHRDNEIQTMVTRSLLRTNCWRHWASAKAFRLSGPPNRQPNEGTRVAFLRTVSLIVFGLNLVLMDFIIQWLPEIIPLFFGRLYDRCASEKPMPGTELSSGGRVEHEVFMWERVIVFLIKVKLEVMPVMSGPKYWDFLAQVMCELECSYVIIQLS